MEAVALRSFNKKMMCSSIHASRPQKALACMWWYGFKYREKRLVFMKTEETSRYYKLQKLSDKPDGLSFFIQYLNFESII
jgi:hypothetical protein